MRAQLESKQAEEQRFIAEALAASSYSAEQDALRLRRIMEEAEEEENRLLAQALEQSRRDKGKGKASQQNSTETEDLDLALAISLSEAEGKGIEGRAETTAQAWERLVRSAREEREREERGDHQRPPEQQQLHRPKLPHPHSDTEILSSGPRLDLNVPRRRTSSYYISNPDIEVAPATPPAQSSTIEEEVLPEYTLGAEDEPKVAVPRPRRGPLPPIPTKSLSRPTAHYTSFHHSSPEVAALLDPVVPPALASPEQPEEGDDPFDEKVAAVGVASRDWDELERSESESEVEVEADVEEEHPVQEEDRVEVFAVREEWVEASTSAATTSAAGSSSTSIAVEAVVISTIRTGPMYGGFVATSGNNAIAEEHTVAGVRFGFVPVGRRNQHPPLENEGTLPFPDAIQLSRIGAPGRSSLEFCSFAVESKNWMSLLVYLGWCVFFFSTRQFGAVTDTNQIIQAREFSNHSCFR